jgi:hypothetical protein
MERKDWQQNNITNVQDGNNGVETPRLKLHTRIMSTFLRSASTELKQAKRAKSSTAIVASLCKSSLVSVFVVGCIKFVRA